VPISCVITFCLRVLNVTYIPCSYLTHASFSLATARTFYAPTYFGYVAEICRSVKITFLVVEEKLVRVCFRVCPSAYKKAK
jgi:hypothetical protein